MAQVLRRGAAKRDLVRHFVYLAESASLEVARRFKDAARDTFVELSETRRRAHPERFVKASSPVSVCGGSAVSSDTAQDYLHVIE